MNLHEKLAEDPKQVIIMLLRCYLRITAHTRTYAAENSARVN